MSEEKKFHVPEVRTEYGRGFLTEYWKDEKPLPIMTGGALPLYYLQQGVKTLFALPMSNTITVITIAISLFLFSGFLLFLKNTDRIISNIGSSLEVTVFLKSGAPQDAVEGFVSELGHWSSVRSVKYVSKEEALQSLRGQVGRDSSFLAVLEKENALPASVDLMLHPDEVGINQVETVVEKLREESIVDEVVYGSEWVGKVQGFLKVFRFFGIVILMTILATVIFLIANTIKLVIYSRRDEIEIMQLVGSTHTFIRVPFLIGGVIQGAVGSVAAVLLLSCAYFFVNYELQRSMVLGVSLSQISFLSAASIAFIVFIGVVIGAVGSLFALRQFLDV